MEQAAWVRLVAVVVAGSVAAAGCGGGSEEASTGAGGEGGSLAELAVIDTRVDVDGEEGSEGQGLSVGELVSTTATGFGEVNFFDGSVTRVAQDARYTVTALSDEEGDRRVEASLDGGTSWNRVEDLSGSGGEFSVETPVATATVTGTAFAVDCVDLPESCTFTVVEGTVEVATPDGVVVELSTGESLTVTADEDPPEPSVLTDEELEADPWIARNLALDRERDGDPGSDDDPGVGEEITVTGILEIDFDAGCRVLDTDVGRVEIVGGDGWVTSSGPAPYISFVASGVEEPPFAYDGNELRVTGTVEDPALSFGECDADLVLTVEQADMENLSGTGITVTGVLRMTDDCGGYHVETPDGLVELWFSGPARDDVPDVVGDFTTDPPSIRADSSSLDGPVIAVDGETVTVTGDGAVGDQPVDNGCGPVIGVVNTTAEGVARGGGSNMGGG